MSGRIQYYVTKTSLIVVAFFSWTFASFSQQPEQKNHELSKDTIVFNYTMGQSGINGNIDPNQIDLGDALLMFWKLNGDFVAGRRLPYAEPYDVDVLLPQGEYVNDTLIVTIASDIIPSNYPSEKIFLIEGKWNRIVFGKNCIEIDCIPFQDPYMPVVPSPTMFSLDKYYLDWDSGRIVRGKKAAGKLDLCALESLVHIDPDRIYTDASGVKKKGYALIKKKKIKKKKWKQEAFKPL